MKEKYADTIRKKAEAGRSPKPPQKKPVFFLTRWNRRIWPLFLTPLFTLLYAPVNRYVTLPLLGSGRAYVDMNGFLIESYFSANSAARILFYLLLITVEVLLFRTTRGMPRVQRVLLLIGATILNLLLGVVFLEFTLWE
ncbi:MAG: hypothetical protein IJW77_18770 [Clostridia bacterium]|nr:hypothetical protein [Clostridia bacterium]